MRKKTQIKEKNSEKGEKNSEKRDKNSEKGEKTQKNEIKTQINVEAISENVGKKLRKGEKGIMNMALLVKCKSARALPRALKKNAPSY